MFRIVLLMFPLLLGARDWTALIYMAADNDLAQWADADMAELELIGSSDDVAIVVQLDKPSIGARRLYVQQGGSSEVQTLGITDMCDWHTLEGFIEWGIRSYPADKYVLVLWDHGTGWTVSANRFFGTDWSSGSRLSVANGDLRKAFSTAYSYTNERIDIVAFDACLMQMAEVLYELKDYANACVALQSLCPLQGFRYDEIFSTLRSRPGMNVRELCRHIVEVNVEEYTNVQQVTFSAVDLTYLESFKENCDKLFSNIMSSPVGYSLSAIRDAVQTIPVIGTIPEPDDEYVDAGDFIQKVDAFVSTPESEHLLDVYDKAIIASGFWHNNFSGTSGFSLWFPLTYAGFKRLIDEYLLLDWAQQSSWLSFLNWFYGTDDIRPTPVHTVVHGGIGANNSFRLSWNRSYDFAPVVYAVVEGSDSGSISLFSDQCNDFGNWYVDGFSIDSSQVQSPPYSFYSGNGNLLDNTIETSQPISVTALGILSIYINYDTEDMADSLIIEWGAIQDVLYGSSGGWIERRILLPEGNYTLKISYRTDSSTLRTGCYIDDITIRGIPDGRICRQNLPDTTLYIFNQPKGTYNYAVYASDAYGNTTNLSVFVPVYLSQYAAPFSVPSPFQTSCQIMIDVPDTIEPHIHIYTVSGRKVKTFSADDVTDGSVYWDGRDEQRRDVGAGIYFVLVIGDNFKRVGKIARQR